MDPKKKTMLVISIAIVIIAGIVVSIGLPFFNRTPNITLPTVGGSAVSDPSSLKAINGQYVPVRVTTETVQEVIATLQRKESYYRELKIERFWGAGSDRQGGSHSVFVWEDQGVTRTIIMASDGSFQNYLMAEGTCYTWFGNEKKWTKKASCDADIDTQNIPSYETVVQLDPSLLRDARYEDKLNEPCIYVETFVPDLGYHERYWVSISTGLLIASETLEEGVVKYRMEEQKITELDEKISSFSLPNGEDLRQVTVLP